MSEYSPSPCDPLTTLSPFPLSRLSAVIRRCSVISVSSSCRGCRKRGEGERLKAVKGNVHPLACCQCCRRCHRFLHGRYAGIVASVASVDETAVDCCCVAVGVHSADMAPIAVHAGVVGGDDDAGAAGADVNVLPLALMVPQVALV